MQYSKAQSSREQLQCGKVWVTKAVALWTYLQSQDIFPLWRAELRIVGATGGVQKSCISQEWWWRVRGVMSGGYEVRPAVEFASGQQSIKGEVIWLPSTIIFLHVSLLCSVCLLACLACRIALDLSPSLPVLSDTDLLRRDANSALSRHVTSLYIFSVCPFKKFYESHICC